MTPIINPPSIRGLMAFESVVRHGSFTRAADELNITQGAVSHQIRKLETVLGAKLLDRDSQGLSLTPFGRRYIEDVRPSLHKIVHATSNSVYDGDYSISIAAPTTFATYYLAPRLTSFRSLFDNIKIEIFSAFRPIEVGLIQSDVTVFFGRKELGVGATEELFSARRYPACSSRYYEKMELSDKRNFQKASLVFESYRPTIWSDWFRQYDVPFTDIERQKSIVLDIQSAAKQAILYDFGIAMLPKYAIEDERKKGTLYCFHDMPVLNDMRYHVCFQENSEKLPVIRQFIDFMKSTCHEDLL